MRRRSGSPAFLDLSILVSVLLVTLACQSRAQPAPFVGVPSPLPVSAPLPAVPGRIVYTKADAFWLFEPSTKSVRELARLPAKASAGAVAVSPDGALVAYALYPVPPQGEAGGVDLYVMARDGANPRVVLAHDGAWTSLTDPAWTPDSQGLYFTRRALDGGERIERVDLHASGRAVVVPDAHSPALSMDGKWLAYLTWEPDASGIALWLARQNGADAARLVGSGEFLSIAAPQFAPDGGRIAFAALQAPQPQTGRPSVFETRVAEAHGLPWDIWTVNVDGTGLRRLTYLGEDSPLPAWSPDGKWVAFGTHSGLYVLEVAAERLWRVADQVLGGAVAWLGP